MKPKLILIFILFFVFSRVIYSQVPQNVYFGVFEEWDLYSEHSIPEAIVIDPKNEDIVWVTQPPLHSITCFNYKTKTFVEFNTGRLDSLPDEIIMDDNGHLWFGEQGGGTLGHYDPVRNHFNHYKAGYDKATIAIPTLDREGYIWISDHNNDKILRFNPKIKEFELTINLPTAKSWVVDLKADSENRIWYACYDSNRIGYISKDRKTLTEYELPFKDSGPAFIAIDSNDRIWFTEWKTNRIGCWDPKKEVFIEYSYPNSKLGPSSIAVDKKNLIYYSNHELNSIVMLNPEEKNYYVFDIPTYHAGLKDGLSIDSKGVIWFTEYLNNRLGRLEIFFTDEIPKVHSKAKLVKGKCVKASKSINKPKNIKQVELEFQSNKTALDKL